ncbi:MAG: hypothetical protein PHU71_05970 [Candidatus Gracilibacteria bacterium]|nr:hypothetical protein [Candidatus Gracilibacteria bacterium]
MKKILVILCLVLLFIPQISSARTIWDETALLHERIDSSNSKVTEIANVMPQLASKADFEKLQDYAVNSVSNTMSSMMWFTGITLTLIGIFLLLVAALVGWIGYHKVLRVANDKINKKVEVAVKERLILQDEENRRLHIGAELVNPMIEFGVTSEENEDGEIVLAVDEEFLKEQAELKAKRKKEQEQQATLSIFNLSEPIV